MLNPQQLKRLQPEVLQFYHNSREATMPKAGLPSLRLSPGPIGDWGTVNESYVAFSGGGREQHEVGYGLARVRGGPGPGGLQRTWP